MRVALPPRVAPNIIATNTGRVETGQSVKSDPNAVPSELEALGIDLVDLPVGAGPICGAAYAKYAAARKRESQKTAPTMPLPDFFVGAHAEAMGLTVITNDTGRFKTYFPKVKLETP